METNKPAKSIPASNPDTSKPSFKGYTMEELQYQKALVALRKEFCKSNLMHSVEGLKHPLESSGSSKLALLSSGSSSSSSKSTAMKVAGTATKLVTKTLLRNMKPLDYVMLGISMIGPMRKMFGMFKKKK